MDGKIKEKSVRIGDIFVAELSQWYSEYSFYQVTLVRDGAETGLRELRKGVVAFDRTSEQVVPVPGSAKLYDEEIFGRICELEDSPAGWGILTEYNDELYPYDESRSYINRPGRTEFCKCRYLDRMSEIYYSEREQRGEPVERDEYDQISGMGIFSLEGPLLSPLQRVCVKHIYCDADDQEREEIWPLSRLFYNRGFYDRLTYEHRSTDGRTAIYRWNAESGEWSGGKTCFEMAAEEEDVGDFLRITYRLRIIEGSASVYLRSRGCEQALHKNGNWSGSGSRFVDEIVEIRKTGQLWVEFSAMMFCGSIDMEVERIHRKRWIAAEERYSGVEREPLMTEELERALLETEEKISRMEISSDIRNLKVLAMYYDPLDPAWQWYVFYGKREYDNDLRMTGLVHDESWWVNDAILLNHLEQAWPDSRVCRRKSMPGVFGRLLEDVLREHGAPGWEDYLRKR